MNSLLDIRLEDPAWQVFKCNGYKRKGSGNLDGWTRREIALQSDATLVIYKTTDTGDDVQPKKKKDYDLLQCEIGSVMNQLVKKDEYPSIMITSEQRSATFCLGFSTLDQALEWRSMVHQVFHYNDSGRRFWYDECRIALSCTSPTEKLAKLLTLPKRKWNDDWQNQQLEETKLKLDPSMPKNVALSKSLPHFIWTQFRQFTQMLVQLYLTLSDEERGSLYAPEWFSDFERTTDDQVTFSIAGILFKMADGAHVSLKQLKHEVKMVDQYRQLHQEMMLAASSSPQLMMMMDVLRFPLLTHMECHGRSFVAMANPNLDETRWSSPVDETQAIRLLQSMCRRKKELFRHVFPTLEIPHVSMYQESQTGVYYILRVCSLYRHVVEVPHPHLQIRNPTDEEAEEMEYGDGIVIPAQSSRPMRRLSQDEIKDKLRRGHRSQTLPCIAYLGLCYFQEAGGQDFAQYNVRASAFAERDLAGNIILCQSRSNYERCHVHEFKPNLLQSSAPLRSILPALQALTQRRMRHHRPLSLAKNTVQEAIFEAIVHLVSILHVPGDTRVEENLAKAGKAELTPETPDEGVCIRDGIQLVNAFKERGINLRYLLVFYHQLSCHQIGLSHLVQAEIVARMMKHLVRHRCINNQASQPEWIDAAHKMVLKVFQLFEPTTESNEEVNEFWTEEAWIWLHYSPYYYCSIQKQESMSPKDLLLSFHRTFLAKPLLFLHAMQRNLNIAFRLPVLFQVLKTGTIVHSFRVQDMFQLLPKCQSSFGEQGMHWIPQLDLPGDSKDNVHHSEEFEAYAKTHVTTYSGYYQSVALKLCDRLKNIHYLLTQGRKATVNWMDEAGTFRQHFLALSSNRLHDCQGFIPSEFVIVYYALMGVMYESSQDWVKAEHHYTCAWIWLQYVFHPAHAIVHGLQLLTFHPIASPLLVRLSTVIREESKLINNQDEETQENTPRQVSRRWIAFLLQYLSQEQRQETQSISVFLQHIHPSGIFSASFVMLPARAILQDTFEQIVTNAVLSVPSNQKQFARGSMTHTFPIHGGVFSSGCVTGQSIAEAAQDLEEATTSSSSLFISHSIQPLVVISKVSCGTRHSALVSRDSGLCFTFGHGEAGVLGHGDERTYACPRLIQVFVKRELLIHDVACGKVHTLAVSTEGHVFAFGWGEGGRLGLGTRRCDKQLTPEKLDTKSFITQVACGREHSLLASRDGCVFSFGVGAEGRLGTGNEEDVYLPVKIDLDKVYSDAQQRGSIEQQDDVRLCTMSEQTSEEYQVRSISVVGETTTADHDILSIAAGEAHSVIATTRGIFTFGFGASGALGHTDDLESQWTPRRIEHLVCPETHVPFEITQVACGAYHTLALTSEGQVLAFGDNQDHQLGSGLDASILSKPTLVNFALDHECVQSVACGDFSSWAVTTSGACYSWGRGLDSMSRELPTRVQDTVLDDLAIAQVGVGALNFKRMMEY